MRKYWLIFLLLSILLPVVIGAFNWLIDPYGIFHPGFQLEKAQRKTSFFLVEPLIKPYQYDQDSHRMVVLGDSHASTAIDPEDPVISHLNPYNYGMSGSGIALHLRALQHALAESDVEQVLYVADFSAFNAYKNTNHMNERGMSPDYWRFIKTVNYRFGGSESVGASLLHPFRSMLDSRMTLFSASAVRDSLHTLGTQKNRQSLSPKGFWMYENPDKRFQWENKFLAMEENYFTDYYFESPLGKYAFAAPEYGVSDVFVFYEHLLQTCYENQLNLKIYLTPQHIRILTILQSNGLIDEYWQWKQELVTRNTKLAKQFNVKPFPIHDFSNTDSPIVTEPIPDKLAAMQWYIDPVHINARAGHELLKIMYGTTPGSAASSLGIRGVLLTPEKVRQLNEKDKLGIKAYLKRNPAVVKRHAELLQRCRYCQ